MKLDLKDNITLPKNNLLNLEEIDENYKEENLIKKKMIMKICTLK